jgi:mRNA interferase MazF
LETVDRYDVYWAALDPTQGSEMAKTRPVVIVSREEMNRVLKTITVCPLTSQIHSKWRSRLAVTVAGKAAEIAVDQIRTISTSRLAGKISSLSLSEAAALRRLITEMYGE